MRIKKGYIIIGIVLVVAFIVGVINEDRFKKEQVSLFTEKNVYETKITESWNVFKKEQEISKDARLDSFSMILSPNGDFANIKLKTIEPRGKKYNVLNFKECISCPGQQANEKSLWNDPAIEVPKFSKMMPVDQFFTILDKLKTQKVFTNEKDNALFLVRSRLWSDEIKHPGKYLRWDGTQLTSIESTTEQNPLQGYILQVVRNNDWKDFISDENTINIIIGE
ncbi:hypothetical protein [Pseudoneobacillus sp. C159]